MSSIFRSLPKAGFRWPEGDKLTNRQSSHRRRDQQIIAVLYRHAGCAKLFNGGNKNAAIHEVSQALSEMFVQSVALICADVLGSDPNTFAFMSGRLRSHVSWGSSIRADTYVELFHELYKARGRWHEAPREPFNVEEHGVLAQAIDRFHEAKGGGSWELKGLDKLARAGGYVHDEDELEEKNPAAMAISGGPSDTTLTTVVLLKMLIENSQKQGLMEQQDGDGDIEMEDWDSEDSEVREMRQRISQANLEERVHT